MKSIDDVFDLIHSLYGLPGYALVLLVCLLAGYLLKRIKAFPNQGIPLAVVLLGGLLNMLLAPERADGQNLRLWLVQNVVVGLLVGGLAWLCHHTLIKRLLLMVPWLNPDESDEQTTKQPQQERQTNEKSIDTTCSTTPGPGT